MRDHASNGWRNASHPYRGAVFVRAVSGGFRAASFFAMTPVGPEALDHRLIWSDLSSYAARDAFDFDFDLLFPSLRSSAFDFDFLRWCSRPVDRGECSDGGSH